MSKDNEHQSLRAKPTADGPIYEPTVRSVRPADPPSGPAA